MTNNKKKALKMRERNEKRHQSGINICNECSSMLCNISLLTN